MNKFKTMETLTSVVRTIHERHNSSMPHDHLLGYIMEQFCTMKDYMMKKHSFFVCDTIYKIDRIQDDMPVWWDEETQGIYGWEMTGPHINVTFDAETIEWFKTCRKFKPDAK